MERPLATALGERSRRNPLAPVTRRRNAQPPLRATDDAPHHSRHDRSSQRAPRRQTGGGTPAVRQPPPLAAAVAVDEEPLHLRRADVRAAALGRTLGRCSAVAAFAIFCVLSGVVYLINDVADREADGSHPVKTSPADRVGRRSVRARARNRGRPAVRRTRRCVLAAAAVWPAGRCLRRVAGSLLGGRSSTSSSSTC